MRQSSPLMLVLFSLCIVLLKTNQICTLKPANSSASSSVSCNLVGNANQKCDKDFGIERAYFYLFFCLRNINSSEEYIIIEVLNLLTA